MRKIRIQVGWDDHWNKEIEHIDLPATPGVHKITETLDWWQPHGRFYVYRTQGHVTVKPDGHADVRIEYRAEDNEEEVKDSVWGYLCFSIRPGETAGKCLYEPIDADPFEREWRRIPDDLSDGLRQKRIRKNKNQISRDGRFRLAVLAEDRRCVITGEPTAAALDVAHIIPVADEGADVIQNAMTLRTDLHRLFDNGLFWLDSNGFVKFDQSSGTLSSYYNDLLKGAQIDLQALERIRPALAVIGT